MTNSKWKLIVLFVICVSVGCASKTQEKLNTEFELLVTDEILEIPIDSATSNISPYLYSYLDQNGGENDLLFSVNIFNNSLEIYSTKKASLLKTLTFEREGAEGVGNLSSVFVQNLDSIFLFNSAGAVYFMVNLENDSLSKYRFKEPLGYSVPMISSTKFSSIPFIHKGSFFFKALPPGSYTTKSNEELATTNLGYSVDLKTGESKKHPFFYPSDYWADFKKHFEFSMANDENRIVYSFFGDHNIYAAELENGPSIKKEAKSKFFKDEFERLPLEGTAMDRGRYFTTSQHYGALIFDPIRRVYYRFCFPELENIDPSQYRDLAVYPKSFAIMVLNEQLEVITEKLFENQAYLPNNAFVGREGLYISMNHPENEVNKEDYFSFKLLKLEEIKD
ncbi:MAG: hypothetical protein COW03_17420 [Cytophagales bacterium CG12_big_fil_rev_8_21_14_0_65_40_12]|nr:MAG: hypothetical protein COW03_17420 [Cytophagales bacterium CG12_big_fil_rev_8_21_14_0_65_40_12]PIW02985.1 MAG: hypothetical protein COW40_16685 [Cytophagales bacterium CG17_big_fil_post_rev_8_21_14_2_50_40_13]